MREIKFRAWDKVSRNWCYMTLPKASLDLSLDIEKFRESSEPVDLQDWQEYTGLKDKNGKEIYEGDILRDLDTQNVVKWDKDITGFEPFNNYDSDCGEFYKIGKCEVVGNLYETPELVEASK